MFITKKHLSRRTFLRGAGVTMALPFLESMVPAATPLAQTAASARRASAQSIFRMAPRWTSGRRRTRAPNFEFSEILKPLEPFRDRTSTSSATEPSAGLRRRFGHG